MTTRHYIRDLTMACFRFSWQWSCVGCSTSLCQPKGRKARLTEGKTFTNSRNRDLRWLTGELF